MVANWSDDQSTGTKHIVDRISIKKLAKNLGMPTAQLIEQLNELGIDVQSSSDTVTGKQQLLLLGKLRSSEIKEKEESDYTLKEILSATNLEDLNDMLTALMANQRIQAIIKDDDLHDVAEVIVSISEKSRPTGELFAVAMLSRLAAVARSREAQVFERIEKVLSNMPAPIDSLEGGVLKRYAAQGLRYANADWVTDYCLRESVNTEKADKARTELLHVALSRIGNVSDWLTELAGQAKLIRQIENQESQLVRVRKVFDSVSDVFQFWDGNLGSEPGSATANCLKSFLRGRTADADQTVLFELMDHVLEILLRIVEMRFSYALQPDTFESVTIGKKILGPGLWARFLNKSQVITALRTILCESASVLARQNKEDQKIMKVLAALYTSNDHASTEVREHFSETHGIDPDIANWWINLGHSSGRKRGAKQRIGNSEDQQIGALLISMESIREPMEKLGRAVVPYLEISDPVLASTLERAVAGYESMAQVVRRLARMRKLSKTDMKGERLEYNPLEHEMLGGHQSGVRTVKVVRDGIRKEFGGRIKTLVKPWVEPDE